MIRGKTIMKVIERTHSMYSTIQYLFFVLTLISLSGCCFIPYPIKEDLETPIDKKELESIERGKTTSLEIIEWLGPPDAIARMGTTMKIPPLGPRKEGSPDVNSQDFLDLFSTEYVITKRHIAYYYETSSFHATGAVMVFLDAGYSGPISPLRQLASRLWILIDTETGQVVDYLFREEGEKFKKGSQEEKRDDYEEEYK
jgi:hypothetical protein